MLYAFTTEESAFTFPPPGLTFDWFVVTWHRSDMWQALMLSIKVSLMSTSLAIVLGTAAAYALYNTRFFGKESINLIFILPLALPGIVTGVSLRSAMSLLEMDFSIFTIVLGHATFCIVIVYNNVLARLRRSSPSMVEASLDLGANRWKTFLNIILPNISTALVAGAMLAFALSFDELIVTIFTSGQQATLPIWIYNQLPRPRDRPVTNVVAIFVVIVTFIPIILAHRLTQEKERK